MTTQEEATKWLKVLLKQKTILSMNYKLKVQFQMDSKQKTDFWFKSLQNFRHTLNKKTTIKLWENKVKN